jgi:3-isopropylmalate dehydrogenase
VTSNIVSIAGANIANPVAMILCVALMFRYSLSMEAEAQRVEDAVRKVLDSGLRTPDLGGKAGTNEVGDAIVSAV